MKKVLIATAAGMLCFFISCKDSSSTSSTSSSTDDVQKNIDNNNKVIKAIETGDSATINSLIADDAVDHMGPNGQPITGGANVRHMLIDMHNHMKDLKMDIITTAGNADYIFTYSRMSGTASDAAMGMPAGTKMDQTGVDVVKVKDGKMTEHWGFVDPAAMMKQMQGMPKMDPGMKDKMPDSAKKM